MSVFQEIRLVIHQTDLVDLRLSLLQASLRRDLLRCLGPAHGHVAIAGRRQSAFRRPVPSEMCQD